MSVSYVEQRNGGYYVAGTRVSLDSVVYAYKRGESPENISHSYPTLALDEVCGAVAYYLAHQWEIDNYLRLSEAEYEREAEERRRQLRQANPELHRRLSARRAEWYGTKDVLQLDALSFQNTELE